MECPSDANAWTNNLARAGLLHDLGHGEDIWSDPRFQEHLVNSLGVRYYEIVGEGEILRDSRISELEQTLSDQFQALAATAWEKLN
jgi:hypothetical protein